MIKQACNMLCVLVAINCCSCYSPRYVYSPVAHNVPIITEKGDSKLAFHYSANLGESKKITTIGKLNRGNGLDIQGAYAVTNHFAVQASYARRWEKNYADYNLNSQDTSIITYSRNSTELGMGYYTFISRRRQSVFQVFGGVSFGKSTFTDKYFAGSTLNDRYLNLNVTRLYLQPALMMLYEDVFVSTLSSRVSIVYFHNIATDYSSEELKNYSLADLDKKAEIFWEPAFINAFGLKKLPGLKIELQLGMAFLMSQRFVDYRTFNFSAGLVADLPKLFEKKKARHKD
ncbi:MAG: hypothetical protein IPP72_04390 [Chitinophagaceae bacterium]|nr:hypothetical protein [Chitinophagaceae bacterium]